MKRSKKKPLVSAPGPEPTQRVAEGFSTYRTPDPSDRFFGRLGEAPIAWNGDARVYRYRITVDRIEEPREVVLARMVDLYRASTNDHDHRTLAREAWVRFGVRLHEVAEAPTPGGNAS